MMLAPALALVAMVAAASPLDDARRVFADGRYADAEAHALAAARPPQEGEALYLVGLARFRAGRPAEALEALEAAGRAPDAPARAGWSFNRGACLYALQRFAEAETAFAQAGEDAQLQAVAWANAGFAALEAREDARAHAWAARARGVATGTTLALVEELEAALVQAAAADATAEAKATGAQASAADATTSAPARDGAAGVAAAGAAANGTAANDAAASDAAAKNATATGSAAAGSTAASPIATNVAAASSATTDAAATSSTAADAAAVGSASTGSAATAIDATSSTPTTAAATDTVATPARASASPAAPDASVPAAPASTPPVPVASPYLDGLDAFDAGRFAEARTLFLAATQADARDGRARLMAGAAALRTGDRDTARADVRHALTLVLDARDRATAHAYLDLLSHGLRAGGPGTQASAAVGTGFDGNVLQVGTTQRTTLQRPMMGMTLDSTPTGSGYVEAGAGLGLRLRPSETSFAELGYGVVQRAYLTSGLRDYSVQLHRGSAALERELPASLRAGGLVSAELYLTGLGDLRGLQAAGGAATWLARDWSDATSTRLDLAYARKAGLAEFDYLTGDRVDATLSQELRRGALSLTGWYRFRRDRNGTLEQLVTGPPPLGTVAPGAPFPSTRTQVIPFSWAGHAGGAGARLTAREGLTLGLDASLEWRRYRSAGFQRWEYADGTSQARNPRRREDLRVLVTPSVTLQLDRRLHLGARYELLQSTSNVDQRLDDAPGACVAPTWSCHALDPSNERYGRHAVTVELGARW